MSYTKQEVAKLRDDRIKTQQLKHSLTMRALYDRSNKNKQKDATRGYSNIQVTLTRTSDHSFVMNRGNK